MKFRFGRNEISFPLSLAAEGAIFLYILPIYGISRFFITFALRQTKLSMTNDYSNSSSDLLTIASVKDGDHMAFGNLYDKYSPSLLGVISKITGAGAVAEDVLQQCFLEIWNKKASYDNSKERLFTWMIKIALNVAVLAVKAGQAKASSETINIRQLVYGNSLATN